MTPELDALLAELDLPSSYRATVERVFAPLADIAMQRHAALGRPLVVGLCGPQGSGKSAGAEVMRHLLAARGLNAALLSLDDLYLARAERARLAAEVHPLLAVRGPPGTHDAGFGEATIDRALAGQTLAFPGFDKASDERRIDGRWVWLPGPADVILFEGWCVGARPEPESALDDPINDLERQADPDGVWRRWVNDALARYQALFARIDLYVLLQPPGFEVVPAWRREQEAKLRARVGEGAGQKVMGDAEVDRFVQHYERLTRWIMREAPARADVVVRLGPAREPLELILRPPASGGAGPALG